jgi:hypothetical protein
MSALHPGNTEDDRIGRTALRLDSPSTGLQRPGTRTGIQAALHLLRNLALLALIAVGAFALCQLLVFNGVLR